MRSSSKKNEEQSLNEPIRECRSNGYLLSARKLGSGAFSKVYLGYATHEKLLQNYKLASDLRSKHHSKVAIKMVATSQAPPEYHKKFLPREIFSLNATYKHVNVIQLYESFRNDRRSYLILELASQGDLLEYINVASNRRIYPGLEEADARRLFRQIVCAVAHCHNNGIVHRDLKCENILLDDNGFVKLTDFGFASQYSMRQSLMNTFCGSVAYTAPEILMTKKYNGVLADLWSLGVILFAMVTGKLPFKERQPYKMLHLIKQGLLFNGPVSPDCKDLIRSLLQWKPGARLGLQQVATHCWMLPATTYGHQKRLLSVGVQTDQSTSQEQQQKKDEKIPNIVPSPKSGSPKSESSSTSENSKRASLLSLSPRHDTGRMTDLMSKTSGPTKQCQVQLPSQSQQEDVKGKTRRFFLYHSGTGSSLKPLRNLPNLRAQGSPPHLSSSHSAIKMPKDKITTGPVVNSEQSEQLISLFPIAAIGRGLAPPRRTDRDRTRLTSWAPRPNT
ncbi:testis-specific serine/threonine-protein kinase 5-like [Ambystoma mexicanum]|uniref:testis-specific serine/threonine-protein kinase 5-like n=1 Tax=Ambystoma mexicanum TaxID=8296 RepID=UPI0037E9AEA3